MELRQLEYFLEICKDNNLTATAQRISITQQGLSKTITALEKELDCHLVIRAKQGLPMQLTPAGVELRRCAQEVLDACVQTRRRMSEFSEHRSLRMMVAGGAPLCLPENYFQEFREKHPEILLDVVEGENDECILALKRGDIDLIIAVPNGQTANFRKLCLAEAPISLIVPKEHPFAQRQEIRLWELNGVPLVAYNSSTVTDLVEQCRGVDIHLNLAYRSYDMFGLFQRCAAQHMCGITLGCLADHVSSDASCVIPLATKDVTWNVTLMGRKTTISRAQDAFWSYSAQCCST
jgi:DNA-binding transcriptional LysR family regulator